MKNTFSSDYQMILKSKYFMKEKEKAHTKPIAWNLSYQLSLMQLILQKRIFSHCSSQFAVRSAVGKKICDDTEQL
ncbi:hypothetical protein T12_3891 [Trichinella patagoniensis]|uniref:Uncharacterized protein n=1 Tax=Trichinella patagoniensis TaxID=990121 RepID=A0A0V0ZJL1_9BILA|nr:hypothetical protein T12_3891 [Trichinella patagoniensis]